MSGISLTAPMRSNLLSLQNIASQQSIVQNRLATGLKVSSAIDNPSSYYTASSLSNRAADLTALLDAMSQGIQTIKSASEAIDAGIKFLEQAKAVANQAMETAEPVVARVSDEEELLAAIDSGQRGLIVIDGDITLSENQTLTLNDGQSLVGADYTNPQSKTGGSLHFNLSDRTIEHAISMADNTALHNLNVTLASSGRHSVFYAENAQNVVFANLNTEINAPSIDGFVRASNVFEIRTSEVRLMGNINIKGTGGNIKGITASDQSIVNLCENSEFNININGGGTGTNQRIAEIVRSSIFNIRSGAKLNGKFEASDTSKSLYATYGSVINIENAAVNIFHKDCGGTLNYALTANSGGCLNISGKSVINIKGQGTTFSALETDATTSGSTIKVGGSSEIHIEQNSPDAAAIKMLTPAGISLIEFAAGAKLSLTDVQNTANTGYWTLDNTWAQTVSSNDTALKINDFHSLSAFRDNGESYNMFTDLPAIDFSRTKWKPVQTVSSLSQFETVLEQYDNLITDASYKGINLLDGQKLKINFNEDRSSGLEVLGVSALTQDIGLTAADWRTLSGVEHSIDELENAINVLRGYASQYGSYYSIVTNRQNFTENLINVLEEGADKLTLADMNQEAANMLALQTSQQLAVNSLSLASQASQAVLRLF